MNHRQHPRASELGELRPLLDKHGYVIVDTGIPKALLQDVVGDIWRHADASPEDRDSWYQPEVVRPRVGMVEMYHYQSMWNIRQHPSLYGIFRALHGTPELWVSMDRVALKPPVDDAHPEYDAPGFIHWDTDINRYPDIPLRVQSVLALEDTDESMGGFQCVPSVYEELGQFVTAYPERPVPRAPELGDHAIVKVGLRAGELVIWKNTMLHGNGRNSSGRVRLAQYVSMNPPPADTAERESLRAARIASWSQNEAAPGDPFPGDPRRIEQRRGAPAQLTPLGRKLVGLDRFDEDAEEPDR